MKQQKCHFLSFSSVANVDPLHSSLLTAAVSPQRRAVLTRPPRYLHAHKGNERVAAQDWRAEEGKTII